MAKKSLLGTAMALKHVAMANFAKNCFARDIKSLLCQISQKYVLDFQICENKREKQVGGSTPRSDLFFISRKLKNFEIVKKFD